MSRINKEEYTTLGDFIKTSFTRDQAAIVARYPKLNAAFLTAFTAKLAEVKLLESGLVLTEQQKAATASLYAEAATLNKELNFLSSYMSDAGLNSDAVTDLKKCIFKNNIEGAVLLIESVKQFVNANKTALTAEGMATTFPTALDTHKTSLAAKNANQNNFMNTHKTLTKANKDQYEALLAYITKIANAGKLVYDGTVTKDEYTLTKIVKRMRAAPRKGKDDDKKE